MDELPDRAIIDLKTAPGEFGDQPAQSEVSVLETLRQPDLVLPRNRLRLVTAHLAWRHAAGLTQTPHPVDSRADADPELLCRPVARQAAGLNRRNHPLAKIKRVRFAHPCWPPFQPEW